MLDKNEIVKMYESGLEMREISEKLSCDKSTVYRILSTNNVNIRNKQSPNYGTVESRKEYIIDLFNKGLSLGEISKITTINRQVLFKLLKKEGYNTSRYSTQRANKLINHLDEIKKMYNDGLSTSQIAGKFNTKFSSIARLLRDNGVTMRPFYKYTVDENFFETIDTEEKAYILGLIFADGNLSKNGMKLSLGLQQEDAYILERIKDIMKYTGILNNIDNSKRKNRKNIVTLIITKRKIGDDLLKLGCVPKKSLVLSFPTGLIPDNLLHHFFRGYSDGDGHIRYNESKSCDFISSKNFIESAQKILKDLGIESLIYNTKNELTKKLTIGKISECKKYLQFIYKDSTIHLTRKYEKAKLIMDL